jgi:hypothetical protein
VLDLPPLSNENLAALHGVVPALALVDPDLPAVVLDRQRMRSAIQSGRGTSPDKVAGDLELIDGRFFVGCLCCALALTMQALSNNHFGAIGRLLRYKEAYADSYWLAVGLEGVAVVLLRKVIALRALAGFDRRTTLVDRGGDSAGTPGRPDGAGPAQRAALGRSAPSATGATSPSGRRTF